MDKRKPIIALDFQNRQDLVSFLDLFDIPLNVKIGMELYYSLGSEIIHFIKERGHDVFLDLKIHDIPNTVKSTMKSLARQDIAMINVHALGGSSMMRAAKDGLLEGSNGEKNPPILLAVTQLTSTCNQQMHTEQGILGDIEENVHHLASLAKLSGLEGAVCSPLEAQRLKKTLGETFLTVTPGIRMQTGQDDQKRTATPYEAALMGSDYIVIGRPVTQANDPVQAYTMICQQWQEGLQAKGGL